MPAVALVPRRIVAHPGGAKTFWSAERNVRVPVEYPQGPHDAPDPVRQQDFNYEGKPRNHAASRQQIVTFMNYHSTLAIEEEEFRVISWPRNAWIGTKGLAGGNLPWMERTNIRKPPAVTYGSLFELYR